MHIRKLLGQFQRMYGQAQPALRQVLTLVVVALVGTALLTPGMAFAQSETLELVIDPAPLFTSISNYVPIFFGILAVAGGIKIGKNIALFVIDAIASAF